MNMTKKDYELIAAILKSSPYTDDDYEFHVARCEHFAKELAKQDKRFKREQFLADCGVLSFRNYLVALYPNYELHQRHVRENDILSETILYAGESYRIRVFDAEVIHWCKV